ncbi:hypothetical protein Focb16_v015454 [Fusarium oxysporum f. sp. cubense]|uniref:Peptidase A1 domain-containing protein n=1 Tax=Fusarium oxysporum f. sp. cubense TaxID=61366 RepID=A0A559KWK5_FUSOC|nr:hypothetical protein Focb16_v015454 [Fusarium oxysporum f. sp. cubense]
MSPILLILITTSLYLFHLARAGPYAGSTVKALIPFAEAESEAESMATPFTSRYHVPIQLSTGPPGTRMDDTRVYSPFVDTGTTGIVLPAASIPGFTVPTGAERGWQYLTSSKILYAGWWIEKDVYFNVNDPMHTVKSTLKILAVTEKTKCDHWEENGDTDTCKDVLPEQNPIGFGILGIGFGRRGRDQPQAFPDRNPTLKVSTIGGVAATWPTFHRGYQIDRRGITIGLTDENMVPFTIGRQPYAQLENPSPGGSGSSLPDWERLRSCVSIDSSDCVPMPALLDTGVTKSYLHMPRNYMRSNFNSLPKSPVAPGSTDNKLDAGHVRINFWPLEGHKNEDFFVDDAATIASGVTPDMVVFWTNNDLKSFRVNTGMHVYRKYKVAFDSVWGRFWLAAANCPRSGCPLCVPVHPCPGNFACRDPRPHRPFGEDEDDPPCCNAAGANAECERQREECRWAGCF